MFLSKRWLHTWVLGLQGIGWTRSPQRWNFKPKSGFLALLCCTHMVEPLSPPLSYPHSYSLHKCTHWLHSVSPAKISIICVNFQNVSSHTTYLSSPIQSSFLTVLGWLLKQGRKKFLAAKCIQFRTALDNLKGLKFLRFEPWVKT